MSKSEQRLDTWLYRTRLLKSRSLATRFILEGKIRLSRNGSTERIKKPGTKVRPGYEILFLRGRQIINVEVLSAPNRRGPAKEAQSHYRIILPEPESDQTIC